jgi:hypothetical protein
MQLEELWPDMVNNVLEATKCGFEWKAKGECNFNPIYNLLIFYFYFDLHFFNWSLSYIVPHFLICHNPSFRLATKAKGLQGYRPRRSPGVTSHTPGSVRKCEGVWGSEPSHSQGDGVRVDSQNFREQFQGSKLNGLWRSLYHWKVLGT